DSIISKQSKNDASVLLAGGGEMLVSYLVTQQQLQEIRDITTDKSKAYVFDTQYDLNDLMAIQDNVAKLVIGNNLYIIDKEVTDYWWDGTDLKVLETELPDMSNFITTLGAITGGGNAITDISIDLHAFALARNTIFVTAGFDQSISRFNTFTSNIISSGIQYSGYDNSSVFLAGGGVKAIPDINASVGLSNCYNKAQIYSQTEINNLLTNMSDVGVSSSKDEDDALLLLNADKTQLIDSCTKYETNNLLLNKTDTEVSYTKDVDNKLLLAMQIRHN
ncbi:MAG: hypothetical protein EZS28_013105, partial [Streblomastix strix]